MDILTASRSTIHLKYCNLNKMKQKMKILHLEDTPSDAELVARELKRGNIDAEILVVPNKAKFINALKTFSPSIILSDHSLGAFDSHEAIRLVKQADINVPFILVTATMTDEFAARVMKEGACDYIIKDRLHRLPSAVINSIEKQQLQNSEKENRAAELLIANIELAFQNDEKENRAAELIIANRELVIQNKEKEQRAVDLAQLTEELRQANDELNEKTELLIKQEETVTVINQDLLLLNQELEERVANRTKALAESENRFRNMMETIPQIAWTNTFEGEITFYNQRWFDYTGLDQEQTKTWGWRKTIHPEDLQFTLDQFRAIRESSDGGEFQVRIKSAEANYRWHLSRLMPINKEEEKVLLWVGTATDIHELRLLQQQKDDFISIASHELKTPITALKANLQVLDRMKDNPSHTMLPNLIGQANKSLDKVTVLVEDLLNATKVNEGQLQLNKKLFTIAKIIDDCCHFIRMEGIYTIITEGDKKLQIWADAERIDQVLVNLVNNAIKYAPESKTIRVFVEKVNNMAKVSITDKGPGITADKLNLLFDRYYRVATHGIQGSGLGLGLYICAEIIKKHKGKIGVDSELGKGSIFWFTLPLA
ncbi:MAG: hypothetical protein JWR54_1351 [Mucilaginibacter sp.]|nr:hypothetical protein [Mucilaginibacter sp.]